MEETPNYFTAMCSGSKQEERGSTSLSCLRPANAAQAGSATPLPLLQHSTALCHPEVTSPAPALARALSKATPALRFGFGGGLLCALGSVLGVWAVFGVLALPLSLSRC
jgi:hypothetical protein